MKKQIIDLALEYAKKGGLKPSNILAFLEVETGGQGFDSTTDKIMIQFEPAWMKKFAPYAPSGLWSLNGVERQAAEWKAFNDAYSKNREAAMKSTSIGLGQIMGFHYSRLGFSEVGKFWDYCKGSLDNQVEMVIKFIKTDPKLLAALNAEDWHTVASIYNGAKYKEMAKKWGREPYDISLRKANEKYLPYNK